MRLIIIICLTLALFSCGHKHYYNFGIDAVAVEYSKDYIRINDSVSIRKSDSAVVHKAEAYSGKQMYYESPSSIE